MATKKKPTAAQLAARAKFVEMVRSKSKAKKSATKKANPKKTATKKVATHKDTKSHNVNIRVVSGTNYLNEISSANQFIDKAQKRLHSNLDYIKRTKPSLYDLKKLKDENSWLRQKINFYKKFISSAKKHIK